MGEYGEQDCRHGYWQDSSNWTVHSSTLLANIVWQKKSCAPFYAPYNNLAIGDSQVAFINGDRVFFFDSFEEEYHIIPAISIEYNNGGYTLLTSSRQVKRIDGSGHLIWKSLSLPFKPYRSATYTTDDYIYVPAYSSLVTLSTDTGRILKTENIGRVYAIDDGLAVVEDQPKHLQLIELDTMRIISELDLDWIISASANVEPLARIIDGYLFLYKTYPPMFIQAYDIQTNNLVWEIQEEFYPNPFFLNKGLAIYTSQGEIKIYSIENGLFLGAVKLESINQSVPDFGSTWVIGEGNMVAISIGSSKELIVLEIKS